MSLPEISLRPAQREILDYRHGFMGISAVPGSGKTWTLSLLAAQIVAGGRLADDQEVLIVTLVNSAVDNFYSRVSGFVQKGGLLPNLGYRVRTLHGLAHDIVRERPDLIQLDNQFQIIDEREAEAIRKETVYAWLRSHPDGLDEFLSTEIEDGRRDWVRREQFPLLAADIAMGFIRSAKDQRLSPQLIRRRVEQVGLPLPLAAMGAEIYADYQRALDYRGAVDFDDLIRLALQALESDADFLARLRTRWPYILEDEAQDSSRLQEQILAALAGPDGNWVRVGDPNQAIYETFTTASPHFLIDFLARADVEKRFLPNSGRSTRSIIDMANELVAWTRQSHPLVEARLALNASPYIEPTPPGDPQPNPEDNPAGIHLVEARFTPGEEIHAIADSLARWLPEHPQATVAVLAPRNKRGFELVDELHRRGLPYEDGLLRSSSLTRFSAGALGIILRCVADPDSARRLVEAYKVWKRADRQDGIASAQVELAAGLLRKIERVEDYIWPGPSGDWLQDLGKQGTAPELLESLAAFRQLVRRWHSAALLPIDQMVLGISQDLLDQAGELAIAHKLAVLLRQASQAHPAWRLPELSEELVVIARNERRFLGFSEEDSGFDPEHHRGKVVVATMHKAKGLEWERVYLMSVNTYDFPAGLPGDTFIAERWYLRDQLNLEAEALAELGALFTADEYAWVQAGTASGAARLDYVRERLRLLYVGITRARQELIVTSNSGREGSRHPALALVRLQDFWKERKLKVEEEEKT